MGVGSKEGRGLGPALGTCACLLALLSPGCDTPPGFVQPGGDERPVDTADLSPVPDIRNDRQGGEAWSTDFVGWQFGGGIQCVGLGPGVPGQIPLENPLPTVVEIWDGIADPCSELPEDGARVLRIELSSETPGTYQVAQQCVDPRTARVTFAEMRGGSLFGLVASEGTVTLLGLDANDVLQGAFSVRFGNAGFTSGGFRTSSACLEPTLFSGTGLDVPFPTQAPVR